MEVLLRFLFSWSSLVYLSISWHATWLEFTRHGGVEVVWSLERFLFPCL